MSTGGEDGVQAWSEAMRPMLDSPGLTCIPSSGVVKTCRLTYESIEVMHALFDQASAKNHWTIASTPLKDYSEHFGPKTEQLDVYPENGRCIFTSYTEKVMNGKGKSEHLSVVD